MSSIIEKNKNLYYIDILRIFFALGIVALHSGFLLNYQWGYYVHAIIFRLGVPFYFFVSGYFLVDKKNRNNKITSSIKKMLPIYFALSILYLLLNQLRFNDFSPSTLINSFWFIITGRSQSVMWYVGALIISSIILLHMNTKDKLRKSIIVSFVLFIIGLLFNTYNFVLLKHESLTFIYNFLKDSFNNNSNAFFIGYLFLSLGYYYNLYYEKKKNYNLKNSFLMLVVSFLLLVFEVIIVKNNILLVENSEYYFSHVFIIPLIFNMFSNINSNKKSGIIRKFSSYIYYFHYAIILFLIMVNDKYGFALLNNSNTFYIITIIITITISLLYYCFLDNKKEKKYGCIYFSLYFLLVYILIYTMINLFNTVVWADEIHTLTLIKKSFKDILLIQIDDIHPPTYFYFLKIFIGIFNKNINKIILGKLFSFIPAIVLLIITNTTVKNNYGKITSFIFSILLVFAPNMINNYFELRMYSFGMMLVTISYILAFRSIKTSNIKTYLLFSISSLITVYIHLYSCLTMGLIYLILLLYLFFKKDYKNFKYMLTSGIIVGFLYLPWLFVVFKQIKTVNSGFWIPGITWNSIIEYINYILGTNSDNNLINLLLLIGHFTIIVVSIVYTNINKKFKDITFVNCGFSILVLVLLIGVVISLLKNPVFVSRYMFFAQGIFWLSIAKAFANMIESKKILLVLILVPILSGIININGFINTEKIKEKNAEIFYNIVNEIPNNSIIITNNAHGLYLISYFKPQARVMLYNASFPDFAKTMYINIEGNYNFDKLKQDIKMKEKSYYFFDMIGTDESMLEINSNFKIISKQFTSIDWYYFDVYEIGGYNG